MSFDWDDQLERDGAYDWDASEPDQIIEEFSKMLRLVTGDGAKKRAAGQKVSWKVDTGHEAAMYRHLEYWEMGEKHDKDSGAHPLVAAAWRALAVAWRETHEA